MSLKPQKSRSLVLRKGRVTDQFHFSVGDTKIPLMTEKPVRSMEQLFTSNLKDTAVCQATCNDLNTWLSTVDKSGLPGEFKAWIDQHGNLP